MEDLERLGVLLGEQAEARILLDGPGEIDDREGVIRRAADNSVIGSVIRNKGATLAARAASARRGEIDFAMSRAVVPWGTSLMLPSGS